MKKVHILIGAMALGLSLAVYLSLGSSTAPQSTFVLLDGSSKKTSDFVGKVALVNFWATSCTTCVAEMPRLSEPTRSTRRAATRRSRSP